MRRTPRSSTTAGLPSCARKSRRKRRMLITGMVVDESVLDQELPMSPRPCAKKPTRRIMRSEHGLRPTFLAIASTTSLNHGLTKGRVMMAIKADAYGHGAGDRRTVRPGTIVKDMLGVSCTRRAAQEGRRESARPASSASSPGQERRGCLLPRTSSPPWRIPTLVEALVRGAPGSGSPHCRACQDRHATGRPGLPAERP